LYTHHRALLLVHIGCGITALVLGLFQFVGSLRSSRHALHRMMGRVYVSATVLGGITGLPLSSMMFAPHALAIRLLFYPMFAGLVSLSIVWPAITLMALRRAMQRRFADHRAWMIRSYALTFAAPTTRLIAPILFLLTGDVVLTLNVTLCQLAGELDSCRMAGESSARARGFSSIGAGLSCRGAVRFQGSGTRSGFAQPIRAADISSTFRE
jgi:uncharacterized membrane protein